MNNLNRIPVITVDGPSGVGKGTICSLLAKQLNWNYLDSGALYRITAYAASLKQLSLESDNETHLAELALSLRIKFPGNGEVLLDNNNISKNIRTQECGNNASIVAAIPKVREALLQKQKDFCIAPGLVADGRDMGTTIFPNANNKIFLTASAEERGNRRYKQLQELRKNAKVAGSAEQDLDLSKIIDEIKQRDERDMTRSASPLVAAIDAITIDTSELSIDQVFKNILELCKLD
jgi:cytidylate kinase